MVVHGLVYAVSFVFFLVVYGFGLCSLLFLLLALWVLLFVFVFFCIVLCTSLLLPLRFFFCFVCGAGSVFMGLPMGLASLSMCVIMLLTWSIFYCSLRLSVAGPWFCLILHGFS